MTSRYILSPEAERDIEQIRDYYLDEAGARVARHVLAQITTAMRSSRQHRALGTGATISLTKMCGSGQCCPI